MTKQFDAIELDFGQCRKDLVDFRSLLDSKPELSESKDISPFFRDHPHLTALSGSLNAFLKIDRICREFDLFGNFNCDWVVGDQSASSFVLIEFEDARTDSIFSNGGKYHEQWGKRFEHGYSQLIDWFWSVDQYRYNVDFTPRFGHGDVRFQGLLVIGRTQFLTPDQRSRLVWRTDHVKVHSKNITCITFDDLYEFLNRRLTNIDDLAKTNSAGDGAR